MQSSAVPGPRARASLARVLDDLGSTLLELVHGDPGRAEEISGVVIHDPLDAPVLPRRSLVLGVGVEEPDRVAELLGELGRRDAAALVLRAPVPVSPEVRAASEAAGVPVLGLSRGAPWAHLAAMLRSLLVEGDVGAVAPESLGGLPSGDLFAVANAIASLLDAPITIEDRNSRVLAFSGRQDEADPSRVETILGRQVPERYSRILSERGVFRELHRSDQPIFVDPTPDADQVFVMPRVAVAVRAGDEVLGSIWAAVPGPLSPERTDALRDAAKLVALHLLRVRAGADVERRVRADLVGSVLEGGPGAREALERLGLADSPLLVLALAVPDPDPETGDDPVLAHERQRLSDAFAVHLSAVHPRSATAPVGGVTYALAAYAGPAGEGEARAVRVAGDFLERIGERLRTVVAVGPVATSLSEIGRSRETTDRVLRVLRDDPSAGPVARLVDVQTESLLMELRDRVLARGEPVTGPLAALVAYDEEHDGSLVATLHAWLEAFGDVNRAAEALYVHPNTFRYRLRRVREVGGLDLLDPAQRFAVGLQLRLWPGLTAGAPSTDDPA
ncbi:CdaR family transcriptional regulator [Nocardioides sp. Arc9.136]|uniref:PucR family transcriptional regulator n=1 Tax=Nocardioides sp. Arc9.136 TaxID=2996826 RepID=UPI0026665102|nr:helix-turn-helix domain-containing protein [Nocardioides sp. Arc9.136]WKN48995.1 helix-turn-helix domain-containing protein [Nocardioides sp. Arc9.136]